MELRANGQIHTHRTQNKVKIIVPVQLNVSFGIGLFLKSCCHVSTKHNKSKLPGIKKAVRLFHETNKPVKSSGKLDEFLDEDNTEYKEIRPETALEISEEIKHINLQLIIECDTPCALDNIDVGEDLVTTIVFQFSGNKSLFRKLPLRKNSNSEWIAGTIVPRKRNVRLITTFLLFLSAIGLLFYWNNNNEVTVGPTFMSKEKVAYAIGALLAFSGLASWSNIKSHLSNSSQFRNLFKSPELVLGESNADFFRAKSVLLFAALLILGVASLHMFSSPVELPPIAKDDSDPARYYSYLIKTESGEYKTLKKLPGEENIKLYAWDLKNVCVGLFEQQVEDQKVEQFCIGKLNLIKLFNRFTTDIEKKPDGLAKITFIEFNLELEDKSVATSLDIQEMRKAGVSTHISKLKEVAFTQHRFYKNMKLESSSEPKKISYRKFEDPTESDHFRAYVLNHQKSIGNQIPFDAASKSPSPYVIPANFVSTWKNKSPTNIESYQHLHNWSDALSKTLVFMRRSSDCGKDFHLLRKQNSLKNSIELAWISFLALEKHRDIDKIAGELSRELAYCIVEIRKNTPTIARETSFRDLAFKSFHLMFAIELKLTNQKFMGKYSGPLYEMLGLDIEGNTNEGWQPLLFADLLRVAQKMELLSLGRFTKSKPYAMTKSANQTLANSKPFNCVVKQVVKDLETTTGLASVTAELTTDFPLSLGDTRECIKAAVTGALALSES